MRRLIAQSTAPENNNEILTLPSSNTFENVGQYFYSTAAACRIGTGMPTIIVKVTRNGQITIPAEFRQKLGIKEGDELLVEATEQGQILFKPIRKLEDCAGIYSKYGKPEEIKKQIDMLRDEY